MFLQFSRTSRENASFLHQNQRFQAIMRHFRDSSESDQLSYVILLNQVMTKQIGFSHCKEYCITPKRLTSLFEETCAANTGVALCCLGQISTLIHQSEDLFHFFRPTICTKSHFGKLLALLCLKEGQVKPLLRKIDGCNFGYSCQGLYDPIVFFLSSYLEKIGPNKEDTSLFFLLMKETGLDAELQQMGSLIEKDLYLSPKGMLSYFIFMCDCANMKRHGGGQFAEDLLSVGGCHQDRLARKTRSHADRAAVLRAQRLADRAGRRRARRRHHGLADPAHPPAALQPERTPASRRYSRRRPKDSTS